MFELVPTKREKITFVCDANLKEALSLGLLSESRSVSNLCELLVRKEVEKRSRLNQKDKRILQKTLERVERSQLKVGSERSPQGLSVA